MKMELGLASARMRGVVFVLGRSRSFVGPAFFEALGGGEKNDGEEENADGNGCAERPIVGGAEEALDDVGDHRAGWAADKNWREKISHGENEGESGSGDGAGKREREDDPEESGAAGGAEVLRGFDEWARDVFERGVNGEEDERRVDM